MAVTYNTPGDVIEQEELTDFQKRLINFIQSGRESVASRKMLQVSSYLENLNIRTVLDVGSWHLKQTIEMLNAFPGCSVHAFEPEPENFNLCRQTHLSLGPEQGNRVKVWRLAAGSRTGALEFYKVDATQGDSNAGAASRYKFKPGMNGSFYNQKWIQKPVTVQEMRLDDWQQLYKIGPVDLVWIDVQGGELEAFRGADKLLDDVKIIFTEVGLTAYYDGQGLKPQIDEYLNAKGFVELTEAFELNGFEYEGNTVYVRS